MEIPNVLTPLLISAVRDAVLYQEDLMRSETIHECSDYEEYHLELTQFLAYIKDEYKKIEKEAGIPLDKLL